MNPGKNTTRWQISNNRGLTILGNTHQPSSAPPRACALLMHGFLGYKDYGFIPVLAQRLAQAGVVVHRFNFSCSGMTDSIETFERTDLFAQDTWGRQVEDVCRVVHAVREGELPGAGLPLSLVGHSRGGDTAILAAGLHADELQLAGVVTINAPADCCRMTDEMKAQLAEDGFLETRSGRTGQSLKISKQWLAEQLEEPETHDLEFQASRITCPVLVMQGDADDTVPMSDAIRLANAAQTTPTILPGGTHVLNATNPADPAVMGEVFETACAGVIERVLCPARPNPS